MRGIPKMISIHDAFMCTPNSLEKKSDVLFTGEVKRTSRSLAWKKASKKL